MTSVVRPHDCGESYRADYEVDDTSFRIGTLTRKGTHPVDARASAQRALRAYRVGVIKAQRRDFAWPKLSAVMDSLPAHWGTGIKYKVHGLPTKTQAVKVALQLLSATDTKPTTSDTVTHYIDRKLDEFALLSRENHVVPEVEIATRKLVSLLGRDIVYPSVTPEGSGGISLFWVAGKSEVEIEISGQMAVYVRIVNSNGDMVVNEERRRAIRPEPLRSFLRDLSAKVEAQAPNWRDHFSR